jgi:SanA protein
MRTLLKYLFLAALLCALACVCLYGYIYYSTKVYIHTGIKGVPVTQVALVLGASVTSGGALSPVLKERADEAIALYNAKKVSKILVTGDNATVSHDEVDPVGKYMVSLGIPKTDIFLDHAGFDTYSSMFRARDVFGVTTVTIVSQPFHLPRAVFIARALGLEAYGAATPGGELFIYNYMREVPASTKATYDLLFSREPKYLGSHYPITGEGAETWGGFDPNATTTLQVWKMY